MSQKRTQLSWIGLWSKFIHTSTLRTLGIEIIDNSRIAIDIRHEKKCCVIRVINTIINNNNNYRYYWVFIICHTIM